MRASRKPSRSKISFAAVTRRARVSTPLRERGPLGLSLPFVSGRAVDTLVSFRAGSRAGGPINVPVLVAGAGGRMPGATASSAVLPLQEEDTRRGASAGGDHGRPGASHLSFACVVAQLLHRFVDETEAVRASLGELAAVRVDREVPVERDAASAVEPVVGLAETAEAQRLEPRDGVEREAVVD